MDALRDLAFGLALFVGAITLDQYQFDTSDCGEQLGQTEESSHE